MASFREAGLALGRSYSSTLISYIESDVLFDLVAAEADPYDADDAAAKPQQ